MSAKAMCCRSSPLLWRYYVDERSLRISDLSDRCPS